jgi:hypothetical protein
MDAKDYIYLALIGLSALVFYIHGVQTGVRRCRKVLIKFFENPDVLKELPPVEPDPLSAPSQPVIDRGSGASFPKTTIRGLFGNN